MRSSDGVDFHFPSALLKWTSPVFEDMFALGQTSGLVDLSTTDASQDAMVVLSEDAETLELLFRFIDPRKRAGKITQNNVTRLLTASEKYQVLQIPHTVEDWFGDREMGSPGPSLIFSHPMLAFTIATRFGLQNAVKAATERLITCPLKNIAVGSPSVIGKLLDERQKRSDWLLGKCNRVIAAVLKTRNLCQKCDVYRTKWIIDLISEATIEPTWSNFWWKVNPSLGSECGEIIQIDGKSGSIQCPGARQGLLSLIATWNKWEKAAREMEARVPSLV